MEKEFKLNIKETKVELSKISVFIEQITVSEIYNGYEPLEEDGTKAYGGKLNIRPPYQREFIYNHEQECSVINSVLHNFPLSLIYWAVNEDGSFEMIDGQQRTLSIMRFISGKFSLNFDGVIYDFEDLDTNLKEKILDYEFSIVKFNGSNQEKLKWFEIINTAGEKLNDQELLNASYHGPFITSARKEFSNKDSYFFSTFGYGGDWTGWFKSPIKNKDGKWILGVTKKEVDRQNILEKVLVWVSGSKKDIGTYLYEHRKDNDSSMLVNEVIEILKWAKETFSPLDEDYYDWMGSVNWGLAYSTNKNSDKKLSSKDSNKLVEKIKEITELPAVSIDKGVIMYLITGEDKYLNIRTFSKKERKKKFKEQNGVCPHCKEEFEFSDMSGDHITPWSKGGVTEDSNLQMLCVKCNILKSNKSE